MIRKTALLAPLVALAAVAAFSASRSVGFEDIPFGTSKADVRDALVKRFDISQVQAFDTTEMRGKDGLRMSERNGVIQLQGYRLSGRPADATLFFNVNDRFFRVEYEATRRPGSYFESTIKDDAVAFSKAFQKQFGPPTFEMNPKRIEMRPGARGYFWRWTKGRETIYTAITAGEDDYGAVAVVSDDRYLKEAPATVAAPPAATDTPLDESQPAAEPPPVPVTPPQEQSGGPSTNPQEAPAMPADDGGFVPMPTPR